MMKWISKLGTNQRLALLALVLGAGALFARPMAAGTTRVNPAELAAALRRQALVEPIDLADTIIKGTSDFRLLDVRDERAFASYHIPGAENVSLDALSDAPIAHNEKVILYSDDGVRSAQAWFVLEAQGFKSVSVLQGGLEGWRRDVLFPILQEAAAPGTRADNDRRRQVSAHFGGAARLGGDGPVAGTPAAPIPSQPNVVAPSLPPGGGVKAAAKKKKEGC